MAAPNCIGSDQLRSVLISLSLDPTADLVPIFLLSGLGRILLRRSDAPGPEKEFKAREQHRDALCHSGPC